MILYSKSEKQLHKEVFGHIDEELKKGAKRIILVVPAQSTLATEEEAFATIGSKGFFNFHVMSGAKLREEILKECGSPDRIAISSLGRDMLLRRIAAEKKDSFASFKEVASDSGFLDMAADFIVQLKQNDIDPAKLAQIAESRDESALVYGKLCDMQEIYAAYEEGMSGKYTDSEDLLSYVTSIISTSTYIEDSIIWYMGFYSFTKREYAFIEELAKKCKAFNIAILCGDSENYSSAKNSIGILSSVLGVTPEKLRDIPKIQETNLIECQDTYTQSLTIAADILRLVRDKGYGYGDFAVLTSGADSAADNIKRVFTDFAIPVFIDSKRSLEHSSAAQFINALLAAACDNLRGSDVVSLFKSGIIEADREALDNLDNYVKRYHIKGKAFLSSFKYGEKTFGPDNFASAEKLRSVAAALLAGFIKDFNESETAENKTKVLYTFLSKKVNLHERLKNLSEKLEENCYYDAASENDQSWDCIIDIFDQLVELLGSQKISSSDYADIIEGAFKKIEIGVLPQSEGKVSVGTVTRSDFSGAKVVYIAGANDGVMPSDKSADSILSSTELDELAKDNFIIAKGNETLENEQLYLVQKAFDCDAQIINICFCDTDENGSALKLSPLAAELGLTPEKGIYQDPENIPFLQNNEAFMYRLPGLLRDYMSGNPLSENWKAGYNILKDRLNNKSLEGLFYTAKEPSLDPGIAELLYEKKGAKGSLSPTQLEQFASCPFKHFLGHGIKPKDERSFEIGSIEIGNIYHETLQILCEELTKPCREKACRVTDPDSLWMTIDEADLSSRIDRIVAAIADSSMDGVFSADESNEYRTKRIHDVCFAYAMELIRQVRLGSISDMYFETKFGRGCTFPALEIDTAFGKVYIEGKIDRTDILQTEGGKYAKIVDYKSGNKEFNTEKIENGLDLQLMVYLESALGSSPELMPGGVFYSHIADESGAYDFIDSVCKKTADEIEKLELKINAGIDNNYRMDGIVLDDEQVIEAIDKKDCKKSTLYNHHSGNEFLSKENMDKIRSSFVTLLNSISSDMLSGSISPKPVYIKGKNESCTFCDYKGVCTFKLNSGV